MGHGAAYYWRGKSEATQIFTTLPFGLNAMELNGWLYYGGGMELYRELYEPFNLRPYPAGNSGCQMGGWFKKPINSVQDLQGLKMRIPGFGGEVLRRNGGTPVAMPGSEIFTALQTGTIDAAEWIGPYNDLTFGFHKVAKHYYYPRRKFPITAAIFVSTWIIKTFSSFPKKIAAPLLAGRIPRIWTKMTSAFTGPTYAAFRRLTSPCRLRQDSALGFS